MFSNDTALPRRVLLPVTNGIIKPLIRIRAGSNSPCTACDTPSIPAPKPVATKGSVHVLSDLSLEASPVLYKV